MRQAMHEIVKEMKLDEHPRSIFTTDVSQTKVRSFKLSGQPKVAIRRRLSCNFKTIPTETLMSIPNTSPQLRDTLNYSISHYSVIHIHLRSSTSIHVHLYQYAWGLSHSSIAEIEGEVKGLGQPFFMHTL